MNENALFIAPFVLDPNEGLQAPLILGPLGRHLLCRPFPEPGELAGRPGWSAPAKRRPGTLLQRRRAARAAALTGLAPVVLSRVQAGASVSAPFASRGEFATRLQRSEAVVAGQARSFGVFGAWTGGTNPVSYTVEMAELVPTTLVIRASRGAGRPAAVGAAVPGGRRPPPSKLQQGIRGDSPIGLLAPRLSQRGGVSGLLLAVEPAAYRRGTE